LLTTNTEDKAIAAPAISGFSSPAIASGSAATAFYAADGSWRVVGKPIQLIAADGGTMLLDAGWISFDADGDVSTVRGPHPSQGVDLADYYCPR
jgi:hypothetical protein